MADSVVIPDSSSSRAGRRGLIMAMIIVALPLVIIAKLPTHLMDVLLSVNLTLSVLILLTVIYVKRPLEFSVFPSLLLITTLFRVVLNIAATRLILTNARDQGDLAAGSVIRAFGVFVSGDSAVVGFIIFAILIIVQFVVITKGATRISEVAARFTLDGMPGKQMAVDADLNAGLITESEARARRSEISREADFYGAMDGASKYVRGDAIAGVLIVVINIVGGLLIGMLQYGFPLDKALSTYTILTVGDGLVTQLPAFIISIAAGLIVTRAGSQSNLGEEMASQLTSHPKALGIAAAFVALLAFTGLPWYVMFSLAAACGLLAMSVARAQTARRAGAAREAEKKLEPAKTPAPEKVDLRVDPLELEVGYGLIRLVDPKQGGDVLERVQTLRRRMGAELGIVVPAIRIRDNVQIEANGYRISIRGNRLASGTAIPGHFLAVDSGQTTGVVSGTPSKEPAFGLPAVWVTPGNRDRAESLGYTVVDAATVISTHLTELIKRHAGELLSREDVQKLISDVKQTAPTVVEELIPARLSVGEVQKVLQNLLAEGVSVRNLELILETLGDWAGKTRDTELLTEYVRAALARGICSKYADGEGRLFVATLDPAMEDAIARGIEPGESLAKPTLSPASARRIVQSVAKEAAKLSAAGHAPVMLASAEIRPHVRKLAAQDVPGLVVLSYHEIVPDVKVESLGMAVME